MKKKYNNKWLHEFCSFFGGKNDGHDQIQENKGRSKRERTKMRIKEKENI